MMTQEDLTEEVEKYLKEYYDEAIKYAISSQFNNTQSLGYDLGYLIVTGGQALKYYLPNKINTLDYDLKFFISPSEEAILDFKERKKLELIEEVNLDEEDIYEKKLNIKTMNFIIYLSNILRSRIARQMIYKIVHYPPDESYKLPKYFDRKNQFIRFRFTVIQRFHKNNETIEYYDELVFDKEKGKNKAMIIKRDEEGDIVKPIEYVPYYYNGAQNFAIRCAYKGRYKKKFVKGEFSIIDIGLNFHNPRLLKMLNYKVHNYNYFYGNKSYYKFRKFLGMTFPFDKNSFIVDNNIRYPDLNYMLFDQIQLLHIFTNTSFPENMVDLQIEKLSKYRRRIDLLLNYYENFAPKQSIESLRKYISVSISRLNNVDDIIKKCFQNENGRYNNTPLDKCRYRHELISISIYDVIYDYLMYLIAKIEELPSIVDDEVMITIYSKKFFSNKTNYSKTVDLVREISLERDESYQNVIQEMCKDILTKLCLLKRKINDIDSSVKANFIEYTDRENFEILIVIKNDDTHHEFTINVDENLSLNNLKRFIRLTMLSIDCKIQTCSNEGVCLLESKNSMLENNVYYDGYLVNSTSFSRELSLKIIEAIDEII